MSAAETTPDWSRRRRPLTWQRALRATGPYWLLMPVLVAIVAILGYPLYRLVVLSFQQYGLFELIRHQGTWVGFDQGAITGGQVVFGGLNGMLIGANGLMTRDLSNPAIEPPPVPITSAAVPELSTWAMMVIGFVGLGVAGYRASQKRVPATA